MNRIRLFVFEQRTLQRHTNLQIVNVVFILEVRSGFLLETPCVVWEPCTSPWKKEYTEGLVWAERPCVQSTFAHWETRAMNDQTKVDQTWLNSECLVLSFCGAWIRIRGVERLLLHMNWKWTVFNMGMCLCGNNEGNVRNLVIFFFVFCWIPFYVCMWEIFPHVKKASNGNVFHEWCAVLCGQREHLVMLSLRVHGVWR